MFWRGSLFKTSNEIASATTKRAISFEVLKRRPFQNTGSGRVRILKLRTKTLLRPPQKRFRSKFSNANPSKTCILEGSAFQNIERNCKLGTGEGLMAAYGKSPPAGGARAPTCTPNRGKRNRASKKRYHNLDLDKRKPSVPSEKGISNFLKNQCVTEGNNGSI